MTLLLGLFAVLLLLVAAAGMVRPRQASPAGRHRGTGRQTRTGVRRLREQGVQ